MTNSITKTFAKRTTDVSEGGDIATIELTTPANAFKDWTIDGKEIPEQSVHAVISTYFFQTLSDAYAGEKVLDDAKAMFDKKLAAMLNGTIGMRSSGGGVDTLTTIMRQIARKAYKGQVDAATYKSTYSDIESPAQNALLDTIIDGNREALEPLAQAELAKRKKEAEATAKLVSSIDISLKA